MTASSQSLGSSAELDAFVSLAQREHRAGRLAEAIAAYCTILAMRPDVAEAYNGLGGALGAQGHLDAAAAQCERAVALKPGLFDAHYNLGNIHWQQGKLDQAVARFRQTIALRPDWAEAHNDLGDVLRAQGKLDEALAQCERAVALKPDLFQAHQNLGNILWQQGKLEQAVARYQQAIALRPDYAEAHNNLGNVLRAQGKLDEALAQCERAVALKPGHFEPHHNLGFVLWRQGKLEQAVATYRRALAINPHSANSHHNLANVLKEQGNLEEAAAEFAKALALEPDLAEAHFSRADLKTFRTGDPDLARLEALAADVDRLPPGKMLCIHFALGKALEDVGDYQRAFEQWRRGNALKRREVNYNEASNQQTLRLIADRFDVSLLQRFQGAGDLSPAPIFVLGMPRSGSTLVEQILASHPQIHAAGELTNLNRVVQSMSDAAGLPFPACIGQCGADDLRRLGEAYLARLQSLPAGKSRIVDKAPGNFLYVGLIRLILPNARIVHTVRDPADTCLSCFANLFEDLPFSYDLAELGRYYRGYQELMAHWRRVLSADAFLDVSYEEVVDNFEQQARRLIDYCGLPWDDRCLKFHETNRRIGTPSNVQVRQPLYRSSLARWRRYAAYLQPLLAELDPCRQ